MSLDKLTLENAHVYNPGTLIVLYISYLTYKNSHKAASLNQALLAVRKMLNICHTHTYTAADTCTHTNTVWRWQPPRRLQKRTKLWCHYTSTHLQSGPPAHFIHTLQHNDKTLAETHLHLWQNICDSPCIADISLRSLSHLFIYLFPLKLTLMLLENNLISSNIWVMA